MNKLKIVPYQSEHLIELLSLLTEVRDTYPVYPPPASAGNTAESFREWLQNEEGVVRKVALSDEKVVGHGMLSKPHDYIVDCLEVNGINFAPGILVEIGKLFVSPSISHGGTGTALIKELVQFATENQMVPISCILEDSPESLALHRKLGFEIIASFDGISGVNHLLTYSR